MTKGGGVWGAVIGVLSSSRLALVLVLVLILLALAGALLPQEGKVEPADLLAWQEGHPGISGLVRPLGLFRVFRSVPFLATIALLALNTLTCTLRRLYRPGSRLFWRNIRDARTLGFLGLHLSLLLLMGGGFHGSATRMDGYLVLTEGQSLPEEPGSYVMLAEGPLRKKEHEGFQVRLEEVTADHRADGSFQEASVKLDFESRDGRTSAESARVNHPVTFQDVSFTLDETGFSPRLGIRDPARDLLLVDTFVALKTFREGGERDYRDFLSLPFLEKKVFLRFLPDHELKDGRPVKRGDKPGRPLLHLWTEDETGHTLEEGFVPPAESARLSGLDFFFPEFRRWAAFRAVQDAGYFWVVAALWLGLCSLLLRYLPDLRGWLSPPEADNNIRGGK